MKYEHYDSNPERLIVGKIENGEPILDQRFKLETGKGGHPRVVKSK